MKYGRNVYACISKFVQFQLVVNIVAVFMTFLGGIILKDAPMNSIQMLWVNLIMDSFASLALATEGPTDELLNRKPISKKASIITNMMMLNISCQSLFQIVTLSVIIFYGDLLFNVPSDRELEHFMWDDIHGYHFTIFFNIFVYMQILNSINCRKLKNTELNVFDGIFSNWLYLLINFIEFAGQILIVTFGGRAVRVQRLTFMQHLACFGIASFSVVIGFLIKFIPVDTEEEVDYGDDQEKPPEKDVQRSFACSSRHSKLGVF